MGRSQMLYYSNSSRAIRLLLLASFGCACVLAQSAALSLSSGSGSPGSTVVLNVSLAATGASPASVEWTFNYSTTDFSSASFAAGPDDSNKSLSCNSGSGTITCLVWGLNNSVIPNGVVGSATLTLSSSTMDTTSSLQLGGISAGTGGTAISTSATGGTVAIVQTPSLNGLTCNPVSISPSSGSTCSVSLTSPAPSGGGTIALSSSPAGANVPTSVIVPQGQTSATFTATAGTVSSATSVTLTASYSGLNATFGITVNPPPPALSSLSVNSSTIASGGIRHWYGQPDNSSGQRWRHSIAFQLQHHGRQCSSYGHDPTGTDLRYFHSHRRDGERGDPSHSHGLLL